MSYKTFLLTITAFLYAYSSVAFSHDALDTVAEKKHSAQGNKAPHAVTKSSMTPSTPDKATMEEVEEIVGGDDPKPSKLEKYALSLNENELTKTLTTRTISDDDKYLSYALTLLAGRREKTTERTQLYKSALLLDPTNEDAFLFLASSTPKDLDSFLETIKSIQNSKD